MLWQFNLTSKQLIAIVTSIALLLVLTFVYLLWLWRADWQLTHPLPTVNQNIDNHHARDMLTTLSSAHLFGQSFQGDVPTTNLQLRVTGIVKMEMSDLPSKAYISVLGQASRVYKKGDQLPNGVKIYAITKDAVIVENNGHLEKCPLPRVPLEFKPQAKLGI
jgi:type II secretory pathway component PulC